jgi:hypothetical protein
MKLSHLLACALLCCVAACTSPTPKEAPTLPATRPADFEVGFRESGGPDDPATDYKITTEQATMQSGEDKWTFPTDPKELDALYAALVELKVLDLKAEVEQGKDKNRFGYRLDLTYSGQKFSVADQGDTYIQQETDYNRFMDVIADIREFVGRGLQSQMIEVAVELVLDAKSPKPTALSVDLEQQNLIALQDSYAPGDTLGGQAKPLKGTYNLNATAQVDGKDWTWTKSVDLTAGPSHTMLLLGKDGFREAH